MSASHSGRPASSSGSDTCSAPASATAESIVRVAGIGQRDRVAGSGDTERDLDQRGLRARDDGDLPVRIELDAVDVRVALGDRLAELGQAREGRVPVHRRGLLARGFDEGVDDVRRRRDVGIAAAEIDQRLAGLGRHGCDAREQ